MFPELVLGFVFILIFWFWLENHSPMVKCRAPGPPRLPLIGNLHQMAAMGEQLPFVTFDKLSQRYGPIMSIKMGMKEAIVISSFEDMSALLSRDECSGRVLEGFLRDRSFGEELGLIFSNGEMWKAVRRFSIRNLRDFGFGRKKSLEAEIHEELDNFVEKIKLDLKSCQNGILNSSLFFNCSLLNVMWVMVGGKKFSYDDPHLRKVMELTEKSFKLGNFGTDVSVAFPFILYIFPKATNAKAFKSVFKVWHEYFGEMINEYRARPGYASAPESFLDVFLAKIDQAQKLDNGNPEKEFFTDRQLQVTLIDLFVTGSETLSGALSYALLFMILHPEVQAKVAEEIEAVVPSKGQVGFEHKSKLVYTQATILEIFRLGNIVPIIPPRKVTQEFNYKGYNFPKDMTIIPNIHSVFSNPEYWDDPTEFKPERFIDRDGKLTNTEKCTPFGFGKRFCMGETQASPAMFLYFTTLLQHFTFSMVGGEAPPTTTPVVAFTLSPQPFKMVVRVRG